MFGPGTLDPNMRRRSVYFFIKRSQLIPSMMLFDWPEHLVGIGQRASTTTAPQALLFMNSPLGRDSADGPRLAGCRRAGPRGSDPPRLQACLRPRPEPRRNAPGRLIFWPASASTYAADNKPEPARDALVDFCQALLSMSECIYIQ